MPRPITTVGELRAALKDYSDTNPIVLLARGNNCLEQWFPIESVGHDPGQVIINIGEEFHDETNQEDAMEEVRQPNYSAMFDASPDMLEALKLCKAFIDHGPSATRSASRCKEAYDKAITKAEGR